MSVTRTKSPKGGIIPSIIRSVIMNVLMVITVLGASLRLTRLATTDTITEPARTALLYDRRQREAMRNRERMLPAPNSARGATARQWAYDLVTCPWCIGLWIAAAVCLAAWPGWGAAWFLIPAGALTVSYLVGTIAERLD